MASTNTDGSLMRLPGRSPDSSARILREKFLAGEVNIDEFLKANAWSFPRTKEARFANQVQSYATASIVIEQFWEYLKVQPAATLFRLAVEKAPAGSVLHAVANEGIPIREIAEVIGRHLNVPVVSITPEDAGAHFGFLGNFLQLDSPVSSELTRKLLNWQPTHSGLIADLEEGHYFDPQQQSKY